MFKLINERSKKLFEEAKKVFQGVNSPVRVFKSVGGTSVFINKAKGVIYLMKIEINILILFHHGVR